MHRWIFVAAAALMLNVVGPASAQFSNRQPTDHPVFEGLLPEGFTVQEAPLDPATFAGRKLVLVPSANFNAFTDTWARAYDPERRNWAMVVMGFDADDMNSSRAASDPRSFSDRVAAALQPYFGSVEAAPDLATAREMGADYYAVIDLWGAFSPMGGRYRTHGGVHLLDGQLRQILVATGRGDVRRQEGSVFDNLRTGFRAEVDATGRTMADGINATATPVLTTLGERLGAPPAAE